MPPRFFSALFWRRNHPAASFFFICKLSSGHSFSRAQLSWGMKSMPTLVTHHTRLTEVLIHPSTKINWEALLLYTSQNFIDTEQRPSLNNHMNLVVSRTFSTRPRIQVFVNVFLVLGSIIAPFLLPLKIKRQTSDYRKIEVPASLYLSRKKLTIVQWFFPLSNTSLPAGRCPGNHAARWTLLELFSLRDRSLNPQIVLFTNENDCFSLKCVGFWPKGHFEQKNAPINIIRVSLHWVMNIPRHTMRQQRKFKEEHSKRVRRKERNWKKKTFQKTWIMVMIKFNDMHQHALPLFRRQAPRNPAYQQE